MIKLMEVKMNLKNLNINVVFVVFVAVCAYAFSGKSNNQINVSGECSKKVAKDRVSIILQVKNLDKNASLASQKSMKTYKAISEYVVGLQKEVPEIELETTEYDTYEKTEWNSSLKKNVKLGVENVIGLSITSPKMDLVGTILAEVSKFSDVYPNGLRTFVSRATFKKEQAACLDEAVKNAQAKAIDMATSVGQSIGKMTHVSVYNDNYSYTSNTRSYKSMAKMAVMEDAEEDMVETGGPSIFTGNADISLKVNTTFELK